MILRLKGFSEFRIVKNVSDIYVQLKLWFGNWDITRNPSLCWSVSGNKQNSLIEIRLIENSGIICGITVVSMPTIHNEKFYIANENIITKIGIPSFDTNAWYEEDDSCKWDANFFMRGYYIRENKDFDVYADEYSVSIVFLTNEVILEVINGSIVFGFDKDDILCFIQMKGMHLNSEGFLEKIT